MFLIKVRMKQAHMRRRGKNVHVMNHFKLNLKLMNKKVLYLLKDPLIPKTHKQTKLITKISYLLIIKKKQIILQQANPQ